MTRREFIEVLQINEVSLDLICFDQLEGKDDVYFLRDNYGRWELSYVERGNENFLEIFSSESDALIILLKKLSIK